MKNVTEEMVQSILLESEIVCQTRLGKITVVTLIMPNGWTITESSASVSENNYDYSYGITKCLEKIKEKIWMLEAYRLKHEEYMETKKEEHSICSEQSIVENEPVETINYDLEGNTIE